MLRLLELDIFVDLNKKLKNYARWLEQHKLPMNLSSFVEWTQVQEEQNYIISAISKLATIKRVEVRQILIPPAEEQSSYVTKTADEQSSQVTKKPTIKGVTDIQ
jgi:hypothetical protein